MKEHFDQTNFDTRFPVQIQYESIKRFELHWHSYLEIFFTLEGSIVITSDNLSFYLDAGDICFLNSGVIHSISQTGIYNRIINMKISVTEKGPFYKLNKYKFDSAKYLEDLTKETVPLSSLQQILFFIFYEYEKKLPGYQNIVLSLLNAFFGIMIRFHYLIPKSDSDSIIDNNLERLNGILQYLDEHYNEKLSLRDIAKQLHMNYYYLSHFFKNVTGVSFHEYITRLRLDKSLTLLADQDKTITSIAFESGFPNTKAYTSAFKNKYGMLPSKYRVSHLEHSPDSGSGISPETIPSERLKQNFLFSPEDIQHFLALYPAPPKNMWKATAHDFKDIFPVSRITFTPKDFSVAASKSETACLHGPTLTLIVDAEILAFFSVDALLELCSAIPFSNYAFFQECAPSPLLTAVSQTFEAAGILPNPAPDCSPLLHSEWHLLNYSALHSCYLVHEFIANLQLPDALPLSFTQIGQTESPFQIGSLLFTLQGIPTPAYYTFSMLYRISGRIIKAQSDYALFQDGNRLFLVFCSRSLPEFVKDAPGSELSLSSYFSKHKELSSERLSFCFPPEHQYRCRLTLLTAGHGAIFDDWCLYGAPKKISAEDGAYFTRIVHPSIRKYESLPEQTLFIDLPPLGCGMAEIQIL